MTKAINILDPRYKSKAHRIAQDISSCGVSGWQLDEMRKKVETKGEVTKAELIEMRDRAAFALRCIEAAVNEFDNVTGNAVFEISDEVVA